jgi:hypothetical protein
MPQISAQIKVYSTVLNIKLSPNDTRPIDIFYFIEDMGILNFEKQNPVLLFLNNKQVPSKLFTMDLACLYSELHNTIRTPKLMEFNILKTSADAPEVRHSKIALKSINFEIPMEILSDIVNNIKAGSMVKSAISSTLSAQAYSELIRITGKYVQVPSNYLDFFVKANALEIDQVEELIIGLGWLKCTIPNYMLWQLAFVHHAAMKEFQKFSFPNERRRSSLAIMTAPYKLDSMKLIPYPLWLRESINSCGGIQTYSQTLLKELYQQEDNPLDPKTVARFLETSKLPVFVKYFLLKNVILSLNCILRNNMPVMGSRVKMNDSHNFQTEDDILSYCTDIIVDLVKSNAANDAAVCYSCLYIIVKHRLPFVDKLRDCVERIFRSTRENFAVVYEESFNFLLQNCILKFMEPLDISSLRNGVSYLFKLFCEKHGMRSDLDNDIFNYVSVKRGDLYEIRNPYQKYCLLLQIKMWVNQAEIQKAATIRSVLSNYENYWNVNTVKKFSISLAESNADDEMTLSESLYNCLCGLLPSKRINVTIKGYVCHPFSKAIYFRTNNHVVQVVFSEIGPFYKVDVHNADISKIPSNLMKKVPNSVSPEKLLQVIHGIMRRENQTLVLTRTLQREFKGIVVFSESQTEKNIRRLGWEKREDATYDEVLFGKHLISQGSFVKLLE